MHFAVFKGKPSTRTHSVTLTTTVYVHAMVKHKVTSNGAINNAKRERVDDCAERSFEELLRGLQKNAVWLVFNILFSRLQRTGDKERRGASRKHDDVRAASDVSHHVVDKRTAVHVQDMRHAARTTESHHIGNDRAEKRREKRCEIDCIFFLYPQRLYCLSLALLKARTTTVCAHRIPSTIHHRHARILNRRRLSEPLSTYRDRHAPPAPSSARKLHRYNAFVKTNR